MNVHEYLKTLGKKAKKARLQAAVLSSDQKNKALELIALSLTKNSTAVLEANSQDIANAKKAGTPEYMLDRLRLSEERIKDMADGIRNLIALPDPVGTILKDFTRPNGLHIQKIRVPMGVIGIIYEARPNVTCDAACLCMKAGSSVILRGGKDAINSNKAITAAMKRALSECGLDENIICLVEDTSRESSTAMMKLTEYIDVLIPRGGAGLIKSVVENSTVPVIETGTGNCHAYVDEYADLDKAVAIIVNGKTQRPSVCNALESVIVHRNIADTFIPMLVSAMPQIEIMGDEEACGICPALKPASDEDYYTEYLGNKISLKILGSTAEAIEWIEEHSTRHSETIITENTENAQKFLKEVDSSSVYHNASTRFTDGGEFGLGAEIGISTQKLHARGPMGLEEITSYKYIIEGNGQIR